MDSKNVIREIVNNYSHINQNLEKLKQNGDILGKDLKAVNELITFNTKVINIWSKNI